jgi:hypothetical protein
LTDDLSSVSFTRYETEGLPRVKICTTIPSIIHMTNNKMP